MPGLISFSDGSWSSRRGKLFLLFYTMIVFFREETATYSSLFCCSNRYRSLILPDISYFSWFSRHKLYPSDYFRCCRARCVNSSSFLSFWLTRINRFKSYSVWTHPSTPFLFFRLLSYCSSDSFSDLNPSISCCFTRKEERYSCSRARIFFLTWEFLICTSRW